MINTISLKHHIEERTMEEIKSYFQPDVFIEYCKACKYYGKIWACPPYDFDIAEYLEGFTYIYIIGSKIYIADLARQGDAEQVFNEIYEAARTVLDEMLLKMEHKKSNSHILLAGRCLTCEHCTKEKQLACIYPKKAHYSLESLGFDVSSISEYILGDKIQWTKEGMPEYLTLVSAILSRDKLDIQDINNSITKKAPGTP